MSPDTPEGPRAPEVVIGFDFGKRRIGIATGDTLTRTARPLPALTRSHEHSLAPQEWARIGELARNLDARRIVVGCPYNADGSEHALATWVRRFVDELRSHVTLPIELVDERYSSLEAEAALRERRSSGARRSRIDRGTIDSTAAAIILERWLAGEQRAGR